MLPLLRRLFASAVLLLCACSQAETSNVSEPEAELPPLDYLFASHYGELRMSAMATGDQMLGAYLVHNSDANHRRSGLLLPAEVHKTQLLALSLVSCDTELATPRPDDFSIIWDYFRTPPKHFMGRINWTCGEVRELYSDVAKNSDVSLPFFTGRRGNFIKLYAPLPPLKNRQDVNDWQQFLLKIELEPLGTLAPGSPFKHQSIDREKVLKLQGNR